MSREFGDHECRTADCCRNYEGNSNEDLSSAYSEQLNTAREFINSNHPLMKLFREKMAFMDFGPIPFFLSLQRQKSGLIKCEKSAPEALRLRNLGNDSFRFKKYEEALMYYSKSVATAPINSTDGKELLALAYGNRSAVLFRVEKYDLCILDVNRALKEVLPESIKQRLQNRKQESWTRLQDQYKCHQMIKKKRLKSGKPVTVIQKKIYTPVVTIDETDLIMDYSSFDDGIWSTELDNALLPGASSKVKLEKNTKWGRHCVATKNIAPGEVLLIQEFCTSMTYEDTHHNYCAYCALWCEALIPCFTCSREMYCNESCRQKAYDSYHRTECQIVRLWANASNEDRAPILFPLRLFLVGTEQGSKLTDLMEDPNVYAIMDGKLNVVGVPYVSNNYLAILNSSWKIHEDVHIIPCAEVLFNDMITILYALRNVQFFDDKGYITQDCGTDGFSMNEGELFAALLLLQHMRLIKNFPGNYTCVSLFDGGYGGKRTKTTWKMVGTNQGSFQLFMNHSCDPNTSVVLDRRRLLIYSTRAIRAGEQVFTSYLNCNYATDSRVKRREFLRNCAVECVCKACVENWPVEMLLSKKENVYLTSNKKVIKKIKNIHKWLSGLMGRNCERSVGDLTENDWNRALASIETIRKNVKEPSSTILLCENLIQICMKMKGNIYVVSPKEEMNTE